MLIRFLDVFAEQEKIVISPLAITLNATSFCFFYRLQQQLSATQFSSLLIKY